MKKAIAVTLFIASLISMTGCGNSAELKALRKENYELKKEISKLQSTPRPTQAPTVTPTIKVNLTEVKIIKEEIDNLKRADLWVILPSSDTLNEDDIKQYMNSIILDYIKENKVTAVTLYLADNETDVKSESYTLGMCQYYPNGNIANASKTTPGDYSTFVFSYNIKARDGKEKPTNLEFEIYDCVYSELDANPTVDEEIIEKQVAEKYGITTSELSSILSKVNMYKYF